MPIRQAMQAFHEERGGLFIMRQKPPKALIEHAKDNGEFRAHSAQFEINLLNGLPGKKIGFPTTRNDQWVCTMAKCCAHALPAGLEQAGEVLNVDWQKNKTGYMDMLKLCKPRDAAKGIRWTYETAEAEYIRMFKYCVDDVNAERAIDLVLPDLSTSEQTLWQLDRKINQRGITIDLQAVADVQFLVHEYKALLKQKCKDICDITPSKTAKLAEWVREQGFSLPNMQAQTIRDTLQRDDLSPEVRKVLRIRVLYAMAAVSKYAALERAVSDDGRLRGMFTYHKAATGRWSSQIVQLQNLYRGKHSDTETLVAAFKTRSLDWLRTMYATNPMKLFATGVRGMFIAGPGKELAAMDYGQVEARCVAWMAGQKDKLKIFKTHGMVYEYTGARIHQLSTKLSALRLMKQQHPEARFDGKVTELACGYQGGKNAIMKMAKREGVDMPPELAEEHKEDWRNVNGKIVSMWYALEEHAIAAVANPGKIFKTNKVMFKQVDDFLYMRLPSGRRLAYYKPEIREGKFGREQLTYLGINTDTRQWMRVATYGGRLTQNAAEGICRDLLARSMSQLERLGYAVVAHVHDEIITEIDQGRGDLNQMREVMCDLPPWAEGFPIEAAGFIAKRYRKE